MAGCSDCDRSHQTCSTYYREVLDKCHRIRGGTCFECQRLSEIEAHIEKTRRALDYLLEERDKMAGSLNKKHDPFSYTLPVELVSDIFMRSQPYAASISVFDDFDEKDHIKGLFNLEQTCQHWRNIVRNTPHLWTIFSSRVCASTCQTSVEITEAWLKRSGGLPLFTSLYVEELESELASNSARDVVTSALLHARRWRVLSLEVPTLWVHWISAALSETNLDGLQHLIFGATNEFAAEDILVLKASPSRFTLHRAWLRQVSINQSRLTHFSCPRDAMTLDECIRIFQNMPNLVSCRLCDVRLEDESDSTPIVVNSSIRKLAVRDCPSKFLDHISFPSLDSLDFHFSSESYDEDEFWLCLQNFIRRSDCKIKEFNLENDDEVALHLMETLKLTPSLERLSLAGWFHKGLFFSLIAANMEPDFMSHLRFLRCSTFIYHYDWSSLAMFLISMKQRSLESFDFRYHGGRELKLDEDTFKRVMGALDGLDYTMLSGDDCTDVVEMHRREYGYGNV